MKRSSLRSKPRASVHDAELSTAWFRAIINRLSKCVECGSKTHLQGHHIIPKEYVKALGRSLRMSDPEIQRWVWDERNGMALCKRCHELHTNRHVTVPRWKLPPCVFVFAEELDRRCIGSPMIARIRREYPDP